MTDTMALTYDEREFVRNVQRKTGLDPLMVGSVLEHLAKAARTAGKPLHRTIERRYNDDGDQIGPDCQIGVEAAYLLAYACERVQAALVEGVANMGLDE